MGLLERWDRRNQAAMERSNETMQDNLRRAKAGVGPRRRTSTFDLPHISGDDPVTGTIALLFIPIAMIAWLVNRQRH